MKVIGVGEEMFNDNVVDFCPCAGTVNPASAALSIQSHRAASLNSVTKVTELLKELVQKVKSGVHMGLATSVFNSKTTTDVEDKSNALSSAQLTPAQMQSHYAAMESAEAWRGEQDEQFQFASADMQGVPTSWKRWCL